MTNVHNIGKTPEKVTNSQALRVLAFLIVIVPLLIPVNILLWKVAVSW